MSDEASSAAPPEAGPGTYGGRLRRLDPAAVTLWRLTTLARGAIFAGTVLMAELVLRLPLPLGLATFVVGVVVLCLIVVVPPLRYLNWGYVLRETDLYLRYGVVFRTTSIVPHARIQHVDTRHGPIDRWLGLAELVVFTAGTRGAILSIPALAGDDAEQLRDRLAELSGAGDAV